MKLVLILDQIQAGAGGKEHADEPMHAKAGPIGSAKMFESIFKELDIKVIGTLYCGDAYYAQNTKEVQAKMVGMVKKLQPDAVLCGPAFNYEGYAKMAAELTYQIQEQCAIPVVAACSQENESVIQEFKDKIHIVKMPKKGGIGLTDSLKNMSTILYKMYKKEDIKNLKETNCF